MDFVVFVGMYLWFSMPPLARYAVWLGLGMALAALVWWLMPESKVRKLVPLSLLLAYLIAPQAYFWGVKKANWAPAFAGATAFRTSGIP